MCQGRPLPSGRRTRAPTPRSRHRLPPQAAFPVALHQFADQGHQIRRCREQFARRGRQRAAAAKKGRGERRGPAIRSKVGAHKGSSRRAHDEIGLGQVDPRFRQSGNQPGLPRDPTTGPPPPNTSARVVITLCISFRPVLHFSNQAFQRRSEIVQRHASASVRPVVKVIPDRVVALGAVENRMLVEAVAI